MQKLQQPDSQRRLKGKARTRDAAVQDSMLRTFANTLPSRNGPLNDAGHRSDDSLLEHSSLHSANFSDKVQVN